jgi:hypothetical protein
MLMVVICGSWSLCLRITHHKQLLGSLHGRQMVVTSHLFINALMSDPSGPSAWLILMEATGSHYRSKGATTDTLYGLRMAPSLLARFGFVELDLMKMDFI